MPYKVVQLGPVTFSSGATTIAANGLVDDANNILVYANTAATSPVQIQVEPTDTGSSWVPLNSGSVTSSGSLQPLIAASSQGYVISNIAFSQIRFVSTGVVNSGTSITISKQISV
jgi:hypothetical protein